MHEELGGVRSESGVQESKGKNRKGRVAGRAGGGGRTPRSGQWFLFYGQRAGGEGASLSKCTARGGWGGAAQLP